MTRPLLLSIVIVNYNAGKYLKSCLDNLQAQTLKEFEVILVDNASTDDSLQDVREIPGLTIIRNPSNRGFAAGQNQGIHAAKGRFLLSLNYDLVMQPDFLEQLVTALQNTPSAGWACGKLLNMTPDYEPSSTIYSVGHVLSPDRFTILRGDREEDEGQYDQPQMIFGAPGAAALYRRELIDSISIDGQFFDEYYFTWYEDVDVDWRATRAGWCCLYVPSAVAYHVGHMGEEYPEPYRSWHAALTMRNRWLTIAVNDSLSALWEVRRPFLHYELSNLLFLIRTGLFGAYLRAIWGFLKSTPYWISKRKQSQNLVRLEAVEAEEIRSQC